MTGDTVKQISREEFKDSIAILNSKGRYPLEWISMIPGEDEDGKFYFLGIQNYVSGETEYFGNEGRGFPSRAAAFGFAGELWDELDSEGREFCPRLTIEEALTRNSWGQYEQ